MPAALQGALDLRQHRDVLLDRQPAHVAKHDSVIAAGAGTPCRCKQLRINTSTHDVARSSGPFPQQVAQLFIRRVDNFCKLVKASSRCKRTRLDPAT